MKRRRKIEEEEEERECQKRATAIKEKSKRRKVEWLDALGHIKDAALDRDPEITRSVVLLDLLHLDLAPLLSRRLGDNTRPSAYRVELILRDTVQFCFWLRR